MNNRAWLDHTLIASLINTAEAALPLECAGLVVRLPCETIRLLRCPKRFTSTRGFDLPAQLFWHMRRLNAQPLAFYHSHPSGDSNLSLEDERAMSIEGRPSWPGLDWLLIPIKRKRAMTPVCYEWLDQFSAYRPTCVTQ